MQHSPERNQKLLIGLAVVISVAIVLSIVFGASKLQNKQKGGEYFDRNSGQTVSDIPGKTPESFGSPDTGVTFLGVSGLLDNGATIDQMKETEKAYTQFITKTNPKFKEVSVNKDGITSARNETTGYFVLTYKTIIGRTDEYTSKLELTGLSSVHLSMYDKNNKLSFEYTTPTNGSSGGPVEDSGDGE